MIELIVFIVLALFILVVYELRERGKKQVKQSDAAAEPAQSAPAADDGECCGQHLVCERETLLQTNATIEYYDDEDLDALAGMSPDDYTPEQYAAIDEVFRTLQERDVPGWVRSLQLRNIALPSDIRDEVLLIVRERRHQSTAAPRPDSAQ